MRALLFGSIGTLADTSELQRACYNAAFAEHGLDWTWDAATYRDLLARSGGRHRIETQAKAEGRSVDTRSLHLTKSRLFQEALTQGKARPRPGVMETIAWARNAGVKLGLVTTTSRLNVVRLLDCLGLMSTRFTIIVTEDDVAAPKPAPDCYHYAAACLATTREDCLAIEDNSDGVKAARAAGLPCLAWPGSYTRDHDFLDARPFSGALLAAVQSRDAIAAE